VLDVQTAVLAQGVALLGAIAIVGIVFVVVGTLLRRFGIKRPKLSKV